MSVEIKVDDDGVVYRLPAPAGQEPHKEWIHRASWLESSGKLYQAIVYSEDDLSIDDPNKKHKRLTLTLEDGT